MTPKEPSLEQIARLIPRDHSRALMVLFSALGVAIGAGAFFAISSVRDSQLSNSKKPSPALALAACPSSPGLHGERKGSPPPFDIFLEERIERDLGSLDVSACARPGGPFGPGRVNLQFLNDGTVRASTIAMEVPQGSFTARFWESPAVASCIQDVYSKARIAPFTGETNNRTARVAFVLRARVAPFGEDVAARALDSVDLSACRVPGVVVRGLAEIVLLPDGRLRAEEVRANLVVPQGGEEPRDAPRRSAEASRCVTRAYSRARAPSFSGTEILATWWFEVRETGR